MISILLLGKIKDFFFLKEIKEEETAISKNFCLFCKVKFYFSLF